MAAKTILAIGEFAEYVAILGRALASGYRVLYTQSIEVELTSLDKEDVWLAIVASVNSHLVDIEVCNLIHLAKLGIPILLAGGDGFPDIFPEPFHNYIPGTPRDSVSEEDISNSIKYFLDGMQKVARESDCLVCRQERNFVSLELNQNGRDQGVAERIKGAITFMKAHCSDEISLNQIAHAAFYSTSHFCRLFKKLMGTTCIKYLSNLRIEKARQLLKETDLTITEICFEAGYSSLTHFERVFRNLEGVSPSEYRQCHDQKSKIC